MKLGRRRLSTRDWHCLGITIELRGTSVKISRSCDSLVMLETVRQGSTQLPAPHIVQRHTSHWSNMRLSAALWPESGRLCKMIAC